MVVSTFPKSIGTASSSTRTATDPDNTGRPAARISGTTGEIQVAHPAYRPEKMAAVKLDLGGREKSVPVATGRGMFWEADGAARAPRDGKLECETMPLDESILIMAAVNKVRYDNRFRYPEMIEKTDHWMGCMMYKHM